MENAYLEREPGDNGGIVYASSFAGIIIALTVFVLVVFVGRVYILRDELATRLHIVESYCITANQASGGSDSFERELKKEHIVTNTSQYAAQLQNIGSKFAARLKDELFINGTTTAGYTSITNGTLASMGPSVVSVSNCYIYEPTYSTSATANGAADAYGHISDYNISHQITGWEVYELTFDGVNFSNTSRIGAVTSSTPGAKIKNGVWTPCLTTGAICEGATIEATINVKFYGPKSLLWKSEGDSQQYDISVTQAVDIVYTANDSRKR